MNIDRDVARRFLLAWQRLAPAMEHTGKVAIGELIRHLGCIQFDPLDICGHNHELVLQARLKTFKPQDLAELLYAERSLIDGLDKVMSIYPVEDWPRFSRRRALDADWSGRRSLKAFQLAEHILAEIEKRGPLSSSDFDFRETVDWAWAPTNIARAALEHLFYRGDLVVHHKVHTRKYYDLTARLLPADLVGQPDPFTSEHEYLDWHALRRIAGVGLLWNRGGDAWVGLVAWNAESRRASIARLLDAGKLHEVRIEGISHPCYLPERALPVLEMAGKAGIPRPRMSLLAPLDNLLWDRHLVSEIFDFDYRWEVYTPAVVRKYGYYILPVLYRDRIVARCEPVRLKKEKTLLIRKWWWEPGWAPDELRTAERAVMLRARDRCLADFAAFLGLTQVRVSAV